MSEASAPRAARRVPGLPLRLRSDDRLARDAAKRDAAAFAALYERHHQPLYRYCRSIVADADDAADALQSSMARAWEAIGERDPAAPVRAWLFRIAHNESISLLRRRRSTEPLEAEALVGSDVAADAERRRRLADLVRDLQGLSERQRGALLMREVSGLGHAEIAAAFGTSEGAVKQSIYEARIALQELAMGREMSCAAVRRELSDGDGRTARSRRLRGHLRSCEDCRAFCDGLRARRSELALIAPLLPAGTAAAVLEAVIGAGGVGGGGLLAGLLGGSAAKTVAVGAATVTAGAGAVTYTAVAPEGDRRVPRPAATEKRAEASVAPPARTRPAVLEARDRDASTLVAQDPAGGDGGGGRGSGPEGRNRGEGGGRGTPGREREKDERGGDEDDERRGDSSGEREDDSSGKREDDSSGPSGSRGSSDDDEPDDDSSGHGSGDVELAEESSGSSGKGSGEAELADDDEPEPEDAEDNSGKD